MSATGIFGLFGLAILCIFVLIVAFNSFFTVEQASAAIVQRFGKFKCVATSGLNFKNPFTDKVVARLSLKVQQFDTNVEAKTKDVTYLNAAVHSVQDSSGQSNGGFLQHIRTNKANGVA